MIKSIEELAEKFPDENAALRERLTDLLVIAGSDDTSETLHIFAVERFQGAIVALVQEAYQRGHAFAMDTVNLTHDEDEDLVPF